MNYCFGSVIKPANAVIRWLFLNLFILNLQKHGIISLYVTTHGEVG